ncbi:MAG TPA: CBS domain-containing protein, partial [Nitrospinaceae bacterium]|nr:CBS domain-containing protein [Nitrospinaceae bacterium]
MRIIDKKRALFGVISPTDLTNEAFKSNHENEILAQDICCKNPLFVLENQSLESTLDLMEVSGHDHIPVVKNKTSKIPIGFIS